VDVFHKRLKTPIDFKEEVGESEDHTQLKMVGSLGLVIAAAILLLLIPVKGIEGKWAVLFVSAFIGGISLLMYLNGRAKENKEHGKWGSHKDVAPPQ